MLTALLLAAILVSGQAQHRVVEPAPRSEAAASTVSVVGASLGSHVDHQLRTPVPKTLFKPTDSIHLSIATRVSGPDPVVGTLGVLWTYGEGEDRQAVNDDSREILFEGQGYTVFEISKPNDWPEGRYQVEVFLNGVSVHRAAFKVR
ncbi:hypothetical protein [Lysobacter sp. cf310]|uniref:hypothetical protein n=1 Tax=Lysobacter sp. cf310 TaxID=1761790 RepID=UPI0008EB5971|nr:hypothetical protein [Lysobacter sp. cf310]SFK72185.1 hypothetical protein SAMN04487938_1740 [Lysobacter sp. cf310]